MPEQEETSNGTQKICPQGRDVYKRQAQDGGVDVLFGEVLFHVGVVHPPDAILVLHQRGVDDVSKPKIV